MATIDTLRNNLIDKLLSISNKDYLIALNQLVEKSTFDDGIVGLSEAQISMLQMSDQDIVAGRLTTHEQAEKEDLEWLKGLQSGRKLR